MMNLALQLFTGNAYNNVESSRNFNIYSVLQKYHKVVEEVLFSILYHFLTMFLGFPLLICWDKKSVKAKHDI